MISQSNSLGKHTVKSYDKDLQNIANILDEMLELVMVSIDMVYRSLQNNSQSMVEAITAHDYKINSLDFLIEKKITTVLALRQPMALDLRYIVSALKVASNLERVGDQAKSIIKKINKADDAIFEPKIQGPLLEMIRLSQKMVSDSVKAFNQQDLELSDEVLKIDDQIDNIYSNFFKIVDHGECNKTDIAKIINLMFIAKSFERLADHATNIAEINRYVVTAETK
jgi:phosphate transport system protein